MIVDAMIVPRTWRAHPVVKFRAMEQCLAHLQQVRLTVHFEADLLANHARCAIATDHVLGTDLNGLTFCSSDLRHNTIRLFRERQQFMSKFHRHIWKPFRHGFEQRLKSVLGDDLIGFERQ